nr:MAG: replication associated protein [Cressdnaviricota sp.]
MTAKATWWSITLYGDEIERVNDVRNFPEWVSKIYGGLEKCPTTDRTHFQGALQCRSQQRFSKIKGWLPTAHIEVARSAEAIKQYAMKSETAIGEKKIQVNPKQFFDAQSICRLITSNVKDRQSDRQKQFWKAVEEIIVNTPDLTGQLMNPSLKNFWVNTATAWDRLEAIEECANSITHIPPTTQENGLCFDADCCKFHEAGSHRDECYICEKCEPNIYNESEVQKATSEASGEEGSQTLSTDEESNS